MEIDTSEGDAVFLYYSFLFAKRYMERYMEIMQEAPDLPTFIALIERELLKDTQNVQ